MLHKHTGSVQTFTAPHSTSYKLEVWGAKGGGSGGKGGYSIGNKSLNSSNNLYVCVGGTGGTNSGNNGGSAGYNGGGRGGNGFQGTYTWTIGGGCGGGGATHIAIANRGVLKNYKEYKSELLLVAGGGGGYGNAPAGGAGGGTSGGNVTTYKGTYSLTGATQTSGYAFGQGQDGITKTQAGDCGAEGNGGGGGGLYGGSTLQKTGPDSDCSGTGGSGYVGAVTNGSTTAGVREGNGYAKITWMPVL